MSSLKDIKEVTKNLKLVDPQKFVDQGRRAYRMVIELSSNPLNKESERRLWETGWKQERDRWEASQRRERGGRNV